MIISSISTMYDSAKGRFEHTKKKVSKEGAILVATAIDGFHGDVIKL